MKSKNPVKCPSCGSERTARILGGHTYPRGCEACGRTFGRPSTAPAAERKLDREIGRLAYGVRDRGK